MKVHVNPDADYGQFNVSSDASADEDGDAYLTAEASGDRLALGPRTFAVHTDTCGRVPVDLEVLEAPSTLLLDDWDHVVEASLDVSSGRLHVLECAGCGRMERVTTLEVAPGNYVGRVFSRGLSPYFDDDRKSKGDEYLLQFWRGPVTERTVLKRFAKRERLSSTALSCLVLAVLFIGFGVYSVVQPTEVYVFQPNYGPQAVTGPSPPPEHLTKRAGRIYGVILLALGAGIGWAVLCRPRRDCDG